MVAKLPHDLHIGIDVTSAALMNRARGVGSYIISLLRGLAAIDRETRYTLFAYAPDAALPTDLPPNFTWTYLYPPELGRATSLLSHQVMLPHIVRRQQIDLLHYPYVPYNPSHPGLALWQPVPTIVTLHDLTPLVYARRILRNARYRFYYRAMLRACGRARRIIADSAQTADDARRFGILPINQPIDVVPLATPTPPAVGLPQTPGIAELLDRPFLLHLGGADHNKNQRAVLDAYAILRERDGIEMPLVLVGGHHLDATATARRSPAIEGGIVRFVGLPSSDLYLLYRHATALLFPSLYEGFGLPILEAMSQGCPVVTSAGGATGEAAGEAALLVDPRDPAQLADAARALIRDERLRAALRSRGRAHAAAFTWERTARATLAAYRAAMEQA